MSAQRFLRADRPTLGAFPVFDRDAAALARAARARCAFQDRLVDTFRTYLEGAGSEPTDSDLRIFALLVATEHQLEQRLNKGMDSGMPLKKDHKVHEISNPGAAL